MARNGKRKSKKFDISSWLPPRVTRNRAKNQEITNLINEALIANEPKPSPNSTRDQKPDRPTPPVAPRPKAQKKTPNPTPKNLAPRDYRAATPEPRTKNDINTILNRLYTNPDFPTVQSS